MHRVVNIFDRISSTQNWLRKNFWRDFRKKQSVMKWTKKQN